MDLLMRLQNEAAIAGGRVHVVLGNHEAMNVLGDLRYVAPGEYAAFAGDEPRSQRDALREAWLARNGADSAAAFDAKFPAGFFAHRQPFRHRGRYGQWLLSLPVAISSTTACSCTADHRESWPVFRCRRSTCATGPPCATISSRSKRGERPAGAAEDPYSERPVLAQQPPGRRDHADEVSLARMKRPWRGSPPPTAIRSSSPTAPTGISGAALCNECSEADVLDPFLATRRCSAPGDRSHVARDRASHRASKGASSSWMPA